MINNNIFEANVGIQSIVIFQITLSRIKLKIRPFCERISEIILEAVPNLFYAICYALLLFHGNRQIPEWISPNVLQF